MNDFQGPNLIKEKKSKKTPTWLKVLVWVVALSILAVAAIQIPQSEFFQGRSDIKIFTGVERVEDRGVFDDISTSDEQLRPGELKEKPPSSTGRPINVSTGDTPIPFPVAELDLPEGTKTDEEVREFVDVGRPPVGDVPQSEFARYKLGKNIDDTWKFDANVQSDSGPNINVYSVLPIPEIFDIFDEESVKGDSRNFNGLVISNSLAKELNNLTFTFSDPPITVRSPFILGLVDSEGNPLGPVDVSFEKGDQPNDLVIYIGAAISGYEIPLNENVVLVIPKSEDILELEWRGSSQQELFPNFVDITAFEEFRGRLR